jgi:ligand-binding sensor protein
MKTIPIVVGSSLAGALLTGAVLLVGFDDIATRLEQHHTARADELIAAYNQGRKDALSLSPVSWDLDEACLALWVKKTF